MHILESYCSYFESCFYGGGGFPGGARGKESSCQYRRHRRQSFHLCVGKIPWREEWLPTPVFLPGESHGQRSLVGYSLWGLIESGRVTNTTFISFSLGPLFLSQLMRLYSAISKDMDCRKKLVYPRAHLFIWLHRVLIVTFGVFVAARKLSGCGVWASLVAVCGPSCSRHMGS